MPRRKHLVVAPWAAFLPGSNWPPAEDMGPLAAWLLCACHAAVCASLLLLALHVGMLPLYTALGPRRHYRHKLQVRRSFKLQGRGRVEDGTVLPGWARPRALGGGGGGAGGGGGGDREEWRG